MKKGSLYFSTIRTTIETSFYKNNVYPVETVKEAYNLAYDSSGTSSPALTYMSQIIAFKGGFKPLGIDSLEILPVEGYEPDFSDASYKKQFIARMNDRVEFIKAKDTVRGGYDKLPQEALDSMKKIAEAAAKM